MHPQPARRFCLLAFSSALRSFRFLRYSGDFVLFEEKPFGHGQAMGVLLEPFASLLDLFEFMPDALFSDLRVLDRITSPDRQAGDRVSEEAFLMGIYCAGLAYFIYLVSALGIWLYSSSDRRCVDVDAELLQMLRLSLFSHL